MRTSARVYLGVRRTSQTWLSVVYPANSNGSIPACSLVSRSGLRSELLEGWSPRHTLNNISDVAQAALGKSETGVSHHRKYAGYKEMQGKRSQVTDLVLKTTQSLGEMTSFYTEIKTWMEFFASHYSHSSHHHKWFIVKPRLLERTLSLQQLDVLWSASLIREGRLFNTVWTNFLCDDTRLTASHILNEILRYAESRNQRRPWMPRQ